MKRGHVLKLLNEYIDGSLDEDRQEMVEKHLSDCPSCVEQLEHLRAVRGEVGSLHRVSAPPGFLQSIHRKLEKEKKKRFSIRAVFSPARVRVPIGFAALATAAIALIFVLNVIAPQKKMQQTEKKSAPPAEAFREKREEAQTEEQMDAAEGAGPEAESEPLKERKDQAERVSAPAKEEPALEEKEKVEDVGIQEMPAAQEVPATAKQERDEPALAAAERAEPPPDIYSTREEPVVISILFHSEEYDRPVSETYPQEDRTEGMKSRGAEMLTAEEEKGGFIDEMPLDREEEPAAPEPSAISSIEDIVSAAGGKIVSLDYGERDDLPQSVTVEIPLSGVEGLVDGLMQLGEIELPEAIRTGDYRNKVADNETSFFIEINFE